jgi:hypothetical protein
MVVNPSAYCQRKHRILSKRGCTRSFCRYALQPNASGEPPPEAQAEPKLEAVGSSAGPNKALALQEPGASVSDPVLARFSVDDGSWLFRVFA